MFSYNGSLYSVRLSRDSSTTVVISPAAVIPVLSASPPASRVTPPFSQCATPQTPCPPTSCGNDAVMSGDKRKLRCTHQGCSSPQTHDTSQASCEYHAQFVLDHKRDHEKAACAPTLFSALSSNKSGDGSATSYYSCLSDNDSTDPACLSATPASTDTSAPPSSFSFWSCFAPATATFYATIDCDKKKSEVLDFV